MADVKCGSCGEPVPEGRFCVRCGAHLANDPGAAGRSSSRRQFAAAPHEHLHVPRLVSTLFPHLPRASMLSFRITVASGFAVVLLLGLLRLLPIAMIAAAVLLPLVTLLYLYDVDVYEEEPLRVVAVTMVWGVVAGVALGLLTRSVTNTGAAVLTQSRSTTIVDQGILLPLLSIVLMLAGPLSLLRYRRFNDVLDGVTFGAACAAAFAGAEVITYGFTILSGGLRPAGDIPNWLARLASIAIAIPVLEMASISAICGAFWLALRAPVRDRRALGPGGNPLVSVVIGTLFILLGFSLEPLMPVGWWLVCLFVLDTVALIWLRMVIHVGLLEESMEIPIGPPIACANCGEQTPRHTFCINCGISLQALPKSRPQSGAAPAASPAPDEGGPGPAPAGGVA